MPTTLRLAARFIEPSSNHRRVGTLRASSRLPASFDLVRPIAGDAVTPTADTPVAHTETGSETLGFVLAFAAVVVLGALGGYAIMRLFEGIAQLQTLVVQNAFLWQR